MKNCARLLAFINKNLDGAARQRVAGS